MARRIPGEFVPFDVTMPRKPRCGSRGPTSGIGTIVGQIKTAPAGARTPVTPGPRHDNAKEAS